MAKKKISILEKVAKLEAMKFSSQLHMLVDFENIFFGEPFGLEICYTCYLHKDDVLKKNSC